MKDAPERVYYACGYAWKNPMRKQDKTEYIRKDLYDELAERVAELEGAIQDALGRNQVTHIHTALRATIEN